MSSFHFAKPANPDLVSIIIPTFNKDRYIGATLESIASQSYTNWEVIVVEDSSSGATENIVRQFAKQHRWRRVSYSRNDRNYGAAHSRNVAFAQAQGEYLALLDADDRWLPEHLKTSVAALKSTQSDLVYSSVLMVDDQTDQLLMVWGPNAPDLQDFPHGLYRRNFITPSATVMRRSVLTDVGPWGLGIRYCEDADYWFRCVAKGKRFHCIGGVHCLYRKNHDGATTQRLCGTLEEFADIAARYVSIPGVRHKHACKCVADAYLNAAHMHQNANPQYDPSADPLRAAPLAVKAWRMRRKHVEHLWSATRMAASNLVRKRPANAGASSANGSSEHKRAA